MLVLCIFSGSVVVTFSGLFKGKLNELEEKVDTDHGLMATLVDSEVINEEHRADIEVIFVIVDSNVYVDNSAVYCLIKSLFLKQWSQHKHESLSYFQWFQLLSENNVYLWLIRLIC